VLAQRIRKEVESVREFSAVSSQSIQPFFLDRLNLGKEMPPQVDQRPSTDSRSSPPNAEKPPQPLSSETTLGLRLERGSSSPRFKLDFLRYGDGPTLGLSERYRGGAVRGQSKSRLCTALMLLFFIALTFCLGQFFVVSVVIPRGEL
jgi:hypothetical protein